MNHDLSKAACLNHPSEWWDTERTTSIDARIARRICMEECPLKTRIACARRALTAPANIHGTWAGVSVRNDHGMFPRSEDIEQLEVIAS